MKSFSMEDLLKLVELQFGQLGVKADDRLAEDLGAESAEVISLVAAVEDRFNLVFKESEIAKISTPQDLFNLIKMKIDES
ncbi:MAG: hypothetical protein JW757_05665 [Anaerolineales bacterium]|nr:hypothetical protein [Anaerolineales bacterium]